MRRRSLMQRGRWPMLARDDRPASRASMSRGLVARFYPRARGHRPGPPRTESQRPDSATANGRRQENDSAGEARHATFGLWGVRLNFRTDFGHVRVATWQGRGVLLVFRGSFGSGGRAGQRSQNEKPEPNPQSRLAIWPVLPENLGDPWTRVVNPLPSDSEGWGFESFRGYFRENRRIPPVGKPAIWW
jgi:hypothetical protein